MIPKVIHYVWLGGNPLAPNVKECIESWRTMCPDYKIMEWNEESLGDLACRYYQEALSAGRWAFASDYARFYVLYRYGGIYLDTDVELVKSLDQLLGQPFMACETDGMSRSKGSKGKTVITVASGLGFGCNRGDPLIWRILNDYESDSFVQPGGGYNLITVVRRVTDILVTLGLQDKPGEQHVEGFRILPKEYFNPMDADTGVIDLTASTFGIHHYHASWFPESHRSVARLRQGVARIAPILPRKVVSAVAWAIYIISHREWRFLCDRSIR